MVAAILGSAIVFLDGAILNVALPAIGRELPATFVTVLEGQTYVSSGYLATLAALLILAGALGDYYGRRRVFAIGLAGFGLTSILCAIAPTLEILAVVRVLQGAAGALLVPGSLAILTASFDGPARSRAFGLWAAATSGTYIIGPLVGGILVDTVSWRAAFLINLPLVIAALWATLRHVRETRDERATGRFDWLGALVAACAIGGLAFGGIRGQALQWRDPLAFATLGIGAVSLVAFPILMARRPNPLVPLELFRIRNFAVINLSTLLVYSALYVTLYFQAIFLQGTLGYSPTAAGAVTLPMSLLLSFLSARVGSAASRMGARRFLIAGPLIMAAGVLWYARIPPDGAAWAASLSEPGSLVPPISTLVDILPAIGLFGLGTSLVVAPLTSTLLSSIPVRNAGVGSAINNALSRIGQPLVSAVIFIVVSASFYGSLTAAVPGLDASSPSFRQAVQPLDAPPASVDAAIRAAARLASADAFHLSAIVAAALLVLGSIVNFVGLRSTAASPSGTGPRSEPTSRSSTG